MVNVMNGGEVFDRFGITNSVKQGRVMAPMLFSISLAAMFEETWGTGSTSNHTRMQTSLQLHTFERRQKHKYIKVRPEDEHKNTEVMFQPNSITAREEDINVDDTTVNPARDFRYLGSIIARDGHIESELQTRMSLTSTSLGDLQERLWNNHNVSTCP